jgi:hypothetical protein
MTPVFFPRSLPSWLRPGRRADSRWPGQKFFPETGRRVVQTGDLVGASPVTPVPAASGFGLPPDSPPASLRAVRTVGRAPRPEPPTVSRHLAPTRRADHVVGPARPRGSPRNRRHPPRFGQSGVLPRRPAGRTRVRAGASQETHTDVSGPGASDGFAASGPDSPRRSRSRPGAPTRKPAKSSAPAPVRTVGRAPRATQQPKRGSGPARRRKRTPKCPPPELPTVSRHRAPTRRADHAVGPARPHGSPRNRRHPPRFGQSGVPPRRTAESARSGRGQCRSG